MRQGLAYGVDLVVMMDIRKHGEFAFEFRQATLLGDPNDAGGVNVCDVVGIADHVGGALLPFGPLGMSKGPSKQLFGPAHWANALCPGEIGCKAKGRYNGVDTLSWRYPRPLSETIVTDRHRRAISQIFVNGLRIRHPSRI
jgi:hypothetical protein